MALKQWMAAMVVVVLACGTGKAQMQGDRIATTDKHPVAAVQDTETAAQRDARMEWWREARFGMFIHWGLYSIPAGTWDGKQIPSIGEWIMNNASIPVADYKALAGKFDPVGFRAHDIVALAKGAGMKYIVITAKHHDGFAMFDSKANAFNIVAATPFKRDPLQELAEECRKQGIKLGFYYSQDQDWTAPGASAILRGDHDPVTHHWDKAQDGDFDTYLHTKAIPQIKELLANYGEFPAVVWFDTPTANMTPARAAEIVEVLNQHPNLIWNNRLGGGYKGDTETPEQYIPPQGFPGRDWESCMTMNETWGFKSYDTDFKSSETLIRNLIDIASKGGNYLLNIGPDSNGRVPEAEVTRLREMGRWLAVNGEAIYATGPTRFGAEAGAFSATEKDKNGKPKFVPSWEWRSTSKGSKVYLEIFQWPGGSFHVPAAPMRIERAYLLADATKKPLKVSKTEAGWDIELAGPAPDPVATVVVLETGAS
jgi:alpha-L-fucosidase